MKHRNELFLKRVDKTLKTDAYLASVIDGTETMLGTSAAMDIDTVAQAFVRLGVQGYSLAKLLLEQECTSNLRGVLEDNVGFDWEKKLVQAILYFSDPNRRRELDDGMFSGTAIGEDFFERQIAPPKLIVPHIIPCAPFGLVGAGGAAKTTIAIKIGLHVVTGRPLWGEDVVQPGPVVFITKEDTREEFEYRLQQVVKQECDPFLPDEQEKIVRDFYIEDLSGNVRQRFVEMIHDNMVETEMIDHLIQKYVAIGPCLIWIDPGVYFGPGERYVNDGEAALMAACRRISSALGCAVGVIHHVSQTVARSGLSDAHSGRGGTAFGDNARGMIVLHPRDKIENPMEGLPPEISPQDVNLGNVTQLKVVKLSHGRPIRETLFVKRYDNRPFRLDFIRGIRVAQTAEEAEQMALAAAEERNEHFVKHYVRAIDHAARNGDRLSVAGCRMLEPRPQFGGRKIPKNDVDALIKGMVDRGLLRKVKNEGGGQPYHLTVTETARIKYNSGLCVVE